MLNRLTKRFDARYFEKRNGRDFTGTRVWRFIAHLERNKPWPYLEVQGTWKEAKKAAKASPLFGHAKRIMVLDSLRVKESPCR